MNRRSLTLLAATILLCTTSRAQDNPAASKPAQATAEAAAALPHDTHDGLTVQASPLVDKLRGKEKFGKANPIDVGVLPVEVFLRNDTEQPIHVDINTIQLELRLRDGGRQDLDWLPAPDVAYLIAHPEGAAPSNRPRIPGLPMASGDKKTDKMTDILQPLSLDGDVVPPKGALHGYLYFNVNHDMTLANTAVLYVPDVTLIETKKALMFFEVPLGKPAQ